jgi:3-hydroxyisobutyrate dehydrogenase
MSAIQVGLAGLGRMGCALAARLLECGVPVVVWNRTSGPECELVSRGATAAHSASALAEACHVVLTSLSDDAALDSVYLGSNGLLSHPANGQLFIDTSTVLPSTVRRIAKHVEQAGASFVDAPVLGTVAPARAGQLIIMVGGAESDVQRAREVLQNVARIVHHVGGIGAGAAMKAALNIPMMAYWAAMADSFKIARAYKLDPNQLAAIIADSPAALAQLRLKLPILLGHSEEVGFDIRGVLKLCEMMNRLNQTEQWSLPTIDAVHAICSEAATAGWGDRDIAALPRFCLTARRTP